LLLTDSTHSIPVQVNRNGLRAIASGTGNPERLELRHVADTADIKEGDLLVSSGLGQRFPAGYPVATVKEVIHDSGQPFAIVRAVPTAALNRSRYLLLVFTDGRSPEQRASDAAQAQEAADRQGQPVAPATLAPVVAPAATVAPAAVAPVAPATAAPARGANNAHPTATHSSSTGRSGNGRNHSTAPASPAPATTTPVGTAPASAAPATPAARPAATRESR
jgi:rod shape-determining protein MreC